MGKVEIAVLGREVVERGGHTRLHRGKGRNDLDKR